MSDPVARLNAALEGRYRVERELGEGGMATVYLAYDLKHERKVALKVLKPELAAVVGAERFLAPQIQPLVGFFVVGAALLAHVDVAGGRRLALEEHSTMGSTSDPDVQSVGMPEQEGS